MLVRRFDKTKNLKKKISKDNYQNLHVHDPSCLKKRINWNVSKTFLIKEKFIWNFYWNPRVQDPGRLKKKKESKC